MAAPKRTPAQRARDLAFIAARVLEGKALALIAEELAAERSYSLSVPSIHRDVKTIKQGWIDQATEDIGKVLGEEIARLYKVEAMATEAWYRSCEASMSRAVNQKGGDTSTTVRTDERYGDPRFLQIIVNCINDRCRLRGADRPEQIHLTNNSVQTIILDGQPIHF